ncbi:uncharacterized protein VTP21DRAFT_2045 [Calcarisporiella thermophila]|uniref:uncharacterized protein n=1 Tax=Calcarisporiella thermophila TaxID=911321 RepID=UPI003742A4DB
MDSKKDQWNPCNYAETGSFVPQLTEGVLSLLALQQNDTLLDLGCGDGILTKRLEQLCSHVKGVDSSQSMIDAARTLGCKDVEVVDGQQLSSWAEQTGQIERYDKVFSNAALHWMKDQKSVIAGVAKCLKPGGAFVAEMGGFLNCGEVHTALISALNKRGYNGQSLSPWYFPTPSQQKRLLEEQGFTVEHIQLVPRPTPIPTSVGDWVETFGFTFLEPLTISERQEVKKEVEEHLRPSFFDPQEGWYVMYVRLRFIAVKGNK